MNNALTRFLERIGLLQPRYVEGWPRGVRRVFPAASSIKAHIQDNDPDLWERMRNMTIYSGLKLAEEEGWIRIEGNLLSDVRLING